MPLASAVTLQYLSPLFTALFAIYLLNQKMEVRRWFYFILAFVGVLFIKGFDTRVSVEGLIIGVIGAAFSGIAYNVVSRIGKREHPLVIVLYFPMVGLPVSAALCLWEWEMPVGIEWLYVLLMGICTQLAQVFLTSAIQKESLKKITPLNYLGVLYALGFGFVLFGETYQWLTYVGMALMIVGILLNLFYGRNAVPAISESDSQA